MSCPDPETIAQWAEGRLPDFGREALLEHLSGCDACRELVLAVAPERRATERRIPMRRKGFSWGGWVAAAAVLTAAAVVWKNLPAKAPATRSGETKLTQVFEPKPALPPPTPAPVDPNPAPPVDPEPKPVDPAPVEPAPKPVDPMPPPVDPGPRVPDPAPQPPTRAVAAIRVLDIRGTLLADGRTVKDGDVVSSTLTAPDGAGFRVDGNVFAFEKSVRLTLSRDGDALAMKVTSGDVYVETDGTTQVFAEGGNEPLAGPTLVNGGKTEVLRVFPAPESRRRDFQKLRPIRRTLVFEDFAAEKDGVRHATAQGGPITGARVAVPAGAAWSKKLAVRVRCRTAAKTVQVGLVFENHTAPWAAMPSAKGGGWQELTLRASDFSAGPMGGAAPAEGDAVAWVTLAINSEEPGSAGASLDIDDLSLFLEE